MNYKLHLILFNQYYPYIAVHIMPLYLHNLKNQHTYFLVSNMVSIIITEIWA